MSVIDRFNSLIVICKILGIAYFNLGKPTNFTDYLWHVPILIVFLRLHYTSIITCGKITEVLANKSIKIGGYIAIITSTIFLFCRIYCNFSNRYLMLELFDKLELIQDLKKKELKFRKTYWLEMLVAAEICLVMYTFYVSPSRGNFSLPMYSNTVIFYFECYLMHKLTTEVEMIFNLLNEELRDIYASLQVKNATTTILKSILSLTKGHYRVIKVCIILHKCFDASLLVVITFLFILITTFSNLNVNKIVISVKDPDEGILDLVSLTAVIVSMNAFRFFFIYKVIVAWLSLYIEAKKTGTIIHDIWNKYASANNVDENVNHLQLISLQILNTELKFTANGFFPLDWTLLHAIIGAVATYVVILIQFEMS